MDASFGSFSTKFVGTGKSAEINALPIRAYVKIWAEWFRDQNVDNPAINSTADATVDYTDDAGEDIEKILQQAYTGGRPLPVNRFHDYFSSSLPSPQRAAEPVKIPLSANAPIRLYTDKELANQNRIGSQIVASNSKTATGIDRRTKRTYIVNKLKDDTTNWEVIKSADENTATDPDLYFGADLQNINATTINQLV